jgi:hypothetical protein
MLHVFLFGLEILRLVYKKAFFLYCTVSILFDLLSSKKSNTTFIKDEEKNFFQIVRKGYQRKRNFALISKMCRSPEFGKREKKFFTEKQIFQALR